MHEGNPVLNIQIGGNGASTAHLYIYLLNVPSFFSRYFNKIKQTSRLGRLLALSLEILYGIDYCDRYFNTNRQFEMLKVAKKMDMILGKCKL